MGEGIVVGEGMENAVEFDMDGRHVVRVSAYAAVLAHFDGHPFLLSFDGRDVNPFYRFRGTHHRSRRKNMVAERIGAYDRMDVHDAMTRRAHFLLFFVEHDMSLSRCNSRIVSSEGRRVEWTPAF